MTGSITFEIDGVYELVLKLESVKYDVKRKGGRAALRKAGQVVEHAAKFAAQEIDDPTTRESIAKNITVRWNGRLFRRTGDLGFRVGVLGGAKQYADTRENRRKQRVGASYATGGDKSNPGGDTWYWRLVEFGVPAHGIDGTEFMQHALESSIDAATDKFVQEYGKSIDRAIRRASRGAS